MRVGVFQLLLIVIYKVEFADFHSPFFKSLCERNIILEKHQADVKKKTLHYLILFFDLPTKTSAQKRKYRQFVRRLVKNGFSRIQFSVYLRLCPSKEGVTHCKKVVYKICPNEGNVLLVPLTGRQFEKNGLTSLAERSNAMLTKEDYLVF